MPATATEPFAASRLTLELMYADLRRLLSELDDPAVAWVPPAPETNSMAGIVRHMLGATASWVTRALGEELQGRDRVAELRSTEGAAVLVGHVDRARDDLMARFDRLADVDPGTVRRFRMSGRPGEQEESAARCVQRAVAHAGEHWGQVQLTRQWYESAR